MRRIFSLRFCGVSLSISLQGALPEIRFDSLAKDIPIWNYLIERTCHEVTVGCANNAIQFQFESVRPGFWERAVLVQHEHDIGARVV